MPYVFRRAKVSLAEIQQRDAEPEEELPSFEVGENPWRLWISGVPGCYFVNCRSPEGAITQKGETCFRDHKDPKGFISLGEARLALFRMKEAIANQETQRCLLTRTLVTRPRFIEEV